MRLLNRLQQVYFCLGLFLILAPVFLLSGATAEVGPVMLLPLLAALLFSAFILRIKKRFRLPCIGLSMAVCFGLSLWLGHGARMTQWVWAGAVLAALAAAVYPRFLGGILEGGSSPVLWYSGLVVAGVVWFIGRAMDLPDAGTMMRRFTWIYSVYLIFALTLESLKSAAGPGRSPSAPMLLKNLGAALCWIGLFLLLTHLPAAAQALRAVWYAVRDGIAWILFFLTRLIPDESGVGGSGGSGGMMDLAGEEQPTSPFWLLLEKIFKVVCIVLIVLAAMFLLYLLLKALRRGFRALAARFRAYMNTVNAGYDDHVESLLDWGEIRRSMNERKQRRQKNRTDRVRWEQLSPRQQVRRSYQNFLRRHPEIPSSRTARQSLPDSRQADIYEAARYSTRDITPEEAASVREIHETRGRA